MLVAANIEARRGRDESAKQITLRKIPTNDGSDGSRSESRTDKGETHANTNPDDGRSTGSGDANGMPNGSENPPTMRHLPTLPTLPTDLETSQKRPARLGKRSVSATSSERACPKRGRGEPFWPMVIRSAVAARCAYDPRMSQHHKKS